MKIKKLIEGVKLRSSDPILDGLWAGIELDALGFGRRRSIQTIPITPTTSMVVMAISTTTTATTIRFSHR